jgi:hypothetical protein
MRRKRVYANILCDDEKRPFKVIVTDGNATATIPVSNTRLSVVKKTMRQIYGVTDMLVSVILKDEKTIDETVRNEVAASDEINGLLTMFDDGDYDNPTI